MNSNLEDGYQRTLVYVGLEDDICGLNVFATYEGGLQGANYYIWWQAVVDFFYRNLRSGLLKVATAHVNEGHLSANEICTNFAEKNPKLDHDELWLGLRFQPTAKLLAILDQHSLNTWGNLNRAIDANFLEQIKNIYAESGVPWQDSTFIKIR